MLDQMDLSVWNQMQLSLYKTLEQEGIVEHNSVEDWHRFSEFFHNYMQANGIGPSISETRKAMKGGI